MNCLRSTAPNCSPSYLSVHRRQTAELRGVAGARFNSARYYVGGNHAIGSASRPSTARRRNIAEYHFFPSLTSVNSASTTFSSPSPFASLPCPDDVDDCASACALAYIASPSFCDALISACAFASSASLLASFCLSTSSASLSAASILPFSSAPTLSPYSPSDFLTLCTIASRWLRACTTSSSFLSSSACDSASLTMRLISSSERPELALMVILFSLPVALSLALTCRMPLASMSKVTSICGMPRGAGGMPSRLNWPRLLLPDATSRSPCSTWIVTADWLSSAVENTCCALVGMVVFFWINLVITPPSVSIPSESGVTSSSNTSLTSPLSTPPWIAAPTATASSGLTSLRGSLPKNSFTVACPLGMLVMAPVTYDSPLFESLPPRALAASRA